MGQGYGSLYVSNNTNAQAVTTAEAKVTALATAGPSAGGATGGNQDVVADPTNKQLKLRAGTYQVSFSLAVRNLYSAVALTARLFLNGEGTEIFGRLIGTAMSGASFASGSAMLNFSGLVTVTDADLDAGFATLDTRLSCPVGTLSVTPTYGQFAAVRVGD